MEDKRIEAQTFLNSFRGRYIISQALHYGIEALEKIPKPYKEVSNLNDMHYLQDNLFSGFIFSRDTLDRIQNIDSSAGDTPTEYIK